MEGEGFDFVEEFISEEPVMVEAMVCESCGSSRLEIELIFLWVFGIPSIGNEIEVSRRA